MVVKQFMALLTRFLPAEVAFEGAGFVAAGVLLAIAGALLSQLWKWVTSAVGDLAKDWFKKNPHRLLPAIPCVPLLAGAALNQPVTVFVMAALAVVVGILQWRSKVVFRIGGLVFGVLVSFVASLCLDGWVVDRRLDSERKRVTVYVVLPFQNFHGEDAQTRLNLSKSLLGTINGIFGTLADVRIEPTTFKVVQDLDEWNEVATVAQRLENRGVRPDVMLANLGTLIDDPGSKQILNLLLRPTFAVAGRKGLTFNRQREIVAAGRLQDIEYLGIRASLELVAELKHLPRGPLSTVNEATIVRNAVTAYITQLQADGACPATPACTAAQEALSKPVIPLDTARDLVRIFPPDERPRLKAIHESRAAAVIGKLGQAATSLAAEPPASVE